MCVCVCVCVCTHMLSHVQLFVEPTRLLCPWNVPGKKYWSRLPLMTPGNLPDSGIKPSSLASPSLAGKFFTTGQIGELIWMKELLLQTTPWSQNLRNTIWVKARHKRDILMTLFYKDACLLSRFSCVWLFATVWTVARQTPLSTGFSRQEHWSGLSCPPPGNLHNPGVFCVSRIEGGFFTYWATWKAIYKGEEQAKLMYDFRSYKVITWNWG